MAHKDEAKIVKDFKSCLKEESSDVVVDPSEKVSGIAMDAYQFLEDSKTFKTGHIFHANRKESIQLCRLGENVEEAIGKESARFLVLENNALSTMENVMKLGFKLKHIGILKPIFVARNLQAGAANLQVGAQIAQVAAQNPQNPQVGEQNHQAADILPKVVSGFSWFDQSFNNWLANQNPHSGTCLVEEEKQMLRTLYAATDEMWRSGYTCDSLADPASYVMIGSRIKILSYLIRPKDDQNDIDFMPLRNDLADLLLHNIAPLWIVPELQDFVLLLRNQLAGNIEDILGHPILLKPDRRQLLYRKYHTREMPKTKLVLLNKRILFSPGWKISSPHSNNVLDSICRKNKNSFSKNAGGALLFADFVSRHFVQHLKTLKGEDWYSHMKDDTVDKALAESVPGLLSKRYALDYDTSFLEA